MEFKNRYVTRDRVYTDPGSPIRIKYGSELDKDKNIIVKEKGTEDLYSYINSFADSVDINVLLARFTNGDNQALMQRAASYIDISSLPTNMNDFVQYSMNATAFFDTLPVEIKEQFGNNVLQFISMVGTDEFNKIMDTSENEIRKEKAQKSLEASKKLKDESNHVPTIVPSVFDDSSLVSETEGDIK